MALMQGDGYFQLPNYLSTSVYCKSQVKAITRTNIIIAVDYGEKHHFNDCNIIDIKEMKKGVWINSATIFPVPKDKTHALPTCRVYFSGE